VHPRPGSQTGVKFVEGKPLETILRQWPVSHRKPAFRQLVGVAHIRAVRRTPARSDAAWYSRRFQSP
jgi:hypothetical protein